MRAGLIPVLFGGKIPFVANLKASNMAVYRAARAKNDVKVAWVGDSITAGYLTTDTSSIAAGAPAARCAAALAARGLTALEQSFWGTHNYDTTGGTSDPRLVRVTTWANGDAMLGGPAWQNFTDAHLLSFTPTRNWKQADIYHTGSDLTAQIDLEAAQNFDVFGQSIVEKDSVTSATLGAHTLKLNRKSYGAKQILGVDTYDPAAPGVRMFNMGAGSYKSADWLPSGVNQNDKANALQYVAPHLTIILLGANDIQTPVTGATYASNLQTLIGKAKLGGGNVILCTITPVDTTQFTVATAAVQADYRNQVIALGLANDLPVVDLFSMFGGSWVVANGAGYMQSDGLHIAPAGQALWANKMAQALAA